MPKTSLSGLTPNMEAIAKYNPSLVVASQDSGGLVAGLAKLGIPVLIEAAVPTLAAAYAQIQQIGQATGHAAQAATAGGRHAAAGRRRRQAGGRRSPGTHLLLGAEREPVLLGDLGHLHRPGGRPVRAANIADKAGKPSDAGYPQLSEEYIVTARPLLIFLADNQAADGGQSPAVVAKRPGWSGIPAVRDREVVGLNDDVASRWGPRIPALVAEIAQAVEQAAK